MDCALALLLPGLRIRMECAGRTGQEKKKEEELTDEQTIRLFPVMEFL